MVSAARMSKPSCGSLNISVTLLGQNCSLPAGFLLLQIGSQRRVLQLEAGAAGEPQLCAVLLSTALEATSRQCAQPSEPYLLLGFVLSSTLVPRPCESSFFCCKLSVRPAMQAAWWPKARACGISSNSKAFRRP